MKLIKSLQHKITDFVAERGSVLPNLFVWVYALLFILCGIYTVFGVGYEFYVKGSVNYAAINSFIKEYFCPSIAGTFAVLGVLLVDQNKNGIPDEWEKGNKNDDSTNTH